MPSYSPSHVRSSFSTILSANNKVIDDLRGASREAGHQKLTAQQIYTTLINQFVADIMTPMNKQTLSDIGHVYASRFEALKDVNAENAASFAALEKKYGALPAVREALTLAHDVVKRDQLVVNMQQDLVDNLTHDLRAVTDFDRRAHQKGKPQLTHKDMAYFDSKKGFKGFWARMFDSHYIQGRRLIKAYAQKTKDIVESKALCHAAGVELDASKDQYKTHNNTYVELTAAERTMSALVSKQRSETQIFSDIQAMIVKDATNDSYFEKLVTRFAAQVPEYLIETRAKIGAFDKLSVNANTKADELKKMASKLEDAMPKLNKAAGNYRAPNISIELDKIEGAFKQAQKVAQHNAKEIKKTTGEVAKYDRKHDSAAPTSDTSILDLYTNIMIYDMLINMNDNGIDAYTLHDAFDIPSNMASDIGLDLDHLVPSVNIGDVNVGDVNNLGDSFNNYSFDTPRFDIPSIPDISVPDFHVPDTSSYSSYDSGGYDGGGGCDGGGGGD